MSTKDEQGKDRQKSPSPGPQAPVGGRGPIRNMDDLKSRGREAAKARAAVKDRPVERFNSLRPALEKALRDRAAREASARTDVKEKPTIHDRQFRHEGAKPQPIIQEPGGGARHTRTTARTRDPQPATPAIVTAAKREPTNADKLFAKIEKSQAERQPIRPPLVKSERGSEKDRER